jgi:hypothetical protein
MMPMDYRISTLLHPCSGSTVTVDWLHYNQLKMRLLTCADHSILLPYRCPEALLVYCHN